MVGSKRLIVGVTGASGVVYGVRLLRMLQPLDEVETHLVVSDAARLTLRHEMDMDVDQLNVLADNVHEVDDMAAPIASGSFDCAGMVIAPCSMKTLSAVANGFGDNLIARAADVVLKERRRLVLLVRETPLNLAHLRNMQAVTEMGGIVYPPLPAFYCRPLSIEDMVDQTDRRVLELFGIHDNRMARWSKTV